MVRGVTVVGWFIFFLLLGYLTTASVTAKRYYWRRHGVRPTQGEPGLSWAGQIGLAWPITIFLPSVQEPAPCSHFHHHARRETHAPWYATRNHARPPADQRPMRDMDQLFSPGPAADRAEPPRAESHTPAPPAAAGQRPLRDLDQLFSREPAAHQTDPAPEKASPAYSFRL